MTIKNDRGISEICMSKIVHCYCPMGSDWYTGSVEIVFCPADEIMDYCDVDDFFKRRVEGQSLIIEEVVGRVCDMLEQYNPKGYSVSVFAEDAVHLPVLVKKIK